MGEVAFIERTGRKRRRKRMLIGGFALLALALGGVVVVFLGPSTPGPEDGTAVVLPMERGPVTEEEAQKAMAEAEAMQTLVSNLGAAVAEAGITDMQALEALMAQAVVVSTAADEMVEAVQYEDEIGGKQARVRYEEAVEASKAPIETLLGQLKAKGVDTRPLVSVANAR